MVQKFYAYYQGKRINAFEALNLKKKRLISTEKRKAELFDSKLPNADPVLPKKAKNGIGLPHFSYYPNQSCIGNVGGTGSEVTLAHVLFQDVFLKLPYFTIKDQNTIIKVFPEEVTVDRIMKTNNHNYILEIVYRLEKTEPYSYYYKWNGMLAVEIVVTTRTEKQKVDDLAKQGIQICEIRVPKDAELKLRKYDKTILSEEVYNNIYNQYFEKYFQLYQNPRFFAFSILLGKVKTLPKWLERYEKMSKWEEQEAEMLKRIELAKRQLSDLDQEILKKNITLENTQKNVSIKEELFSKIKSLQRQVQIKDNQLKEEHREKRKLETDCSIYKKKIETIETSPLKYVFNHMIRRK